MPEQVFCLDELAISLPVIDRRGSLECLDGLVDEIPGVHGRATYQAVCALRATRSARSARRGLRDPRTFRGSSRATIGW
jgi:hypothetical protein